MLGLLLVFQDGEVFAGKRGASKRAAGSSKRFKGGSKQVIQASQNVAVNEQAVENNESDEVFTESKNDDRVSELSKANSQMLDKLSDAQNKNAQMSADLSAAQDKIDELELDALQKNVADKQIENQKATARTLSGNYSNAIAELQNKCSGVGSGFNKVLSSLGFATATSTITALGSATASAGQFVNRSSDKMNNAMDLTQKIASTTASVSSVASTVSVATATKNMESAVSKLKACRSQVSEFQKVVNKIGDEADNMAQQENYDETVYEKLNDYVSAGNKIISACNGLNEKDSNDVLKMMKASTAVSAVGSAAAVVGSTLEVVSAVKGGLGDKQNIAYTAGNIGSSVASLGATILNGVAQNKLKKVAQSAVDCEQIIK